MAFVNKLGQSISFECSELIDDLKEDISRFGGDLVVEVVTEEREDVTIYKDYTCNDDKNAACELAETEKTKKLTASALLILYEQQNSIL